MTTPATPVETVSRWLDLDTVVCRREVRDAIAAIVKAERERAWHPIETAPKDGTLVILSGAGRVTAGAWYEWEGTEDVEGGANWSDWYGGFTDEHPATRWQPLPAGEQDQCP